MKAYTHTDLNINKNITPRVPVATCNNKEFNSFLIDNNKKLSDLKNGCNSYIFKLPSDKVTHVDFKYLNISKNEEYNAVENNDYNKNKLYANDKAYKQFIDITNRCIWYNKDNNEVSLSEQPRCGIFNVKSKKYGEIVFTLIASCINNGIENNRNTKSLDVWVDAWINNSYHGPMRIGTIVRFFNKVGVKEDVFLFLNQDNSVYKILGHLQNDKLDDILLSFYNKNITTLSMLKREKAKIEYEEKSNLKITAAVKEVFNFSSGKDVPQQTAVSVNTDSVVNVTKRYKLNIARLIGQLVSSVLSLNPNLYSSTKKFQEKVENYEILYTINRVKNHDARLLTILKIYDFEKKKIILNPDNKIKISYLHSRGKTQQVYYYINNSKNNPKFLIHDMNTNDKIIYDIETELKNLDSDNNDLKNMKAKNEKLNLFSKVNSLEKKEIGDIFFYDFKNYKIHLSLLLKKYIEFFKENKITPLIDLTTGANYGYIVNDLNGDTRGFFAELIAKNNVIKHMDVRSKVSSYYSFSSDLIVMFDKVIKNKLIFYKINKHTKNINDLLANKYDFDDCASTPDGYWEIDYIEGLRDGDNKNEVIEKDTENKTPEIQKTQPDLKQYAETNEMIIINEPFNKQSKVNDRKNEELNKELATISQELGKTPEQINYEVTSENKNENVIAKNKNSNYNIRIKRNGISVKIKIPGDDIELYSKENRIALLFEAFTKVFEK